MSFRVVVDFVRAFSDDRNLEKPLAGIAELLGADAVRFERISTGIAKGRTLAQYCRDAHLVYTPRNWASVSAEVLKLDTIRARPGSVWIVSELLEPRDRRALFSELATDNPSRDAILVPLDVRRQHTDVLEIHYRNDVQDHNRVLIASLAQMLATLWSEKVDAEAAPRQTPQAVTATPASGANSAILSDANPYNLSRAEFGVCQLIRDGLRAADIARRLGVQEATVRSHLRSIYAKLDVTGHVGLLYALSNTGRPEVASVQTLKPRQAAPIRMHSYGR